jgi:DNA-binding transcriptional LysR family regulator
MHLKALKVFCDVVRHRSFSEAATSNDISQPGVSQMVSQLEEHLGVRLIDRSKRPLVPTAEGEVFYEGCRKLVQRYLMLEEEVRTLHQEVAGRVSVASIYSVGLSHMNRFVRDFMQRHPKANVRIQYQHPDRVYELVETDQVDLGLVSYPKASRAIKAIEWREEPMVVVCSRTHALAWRDEVGLGELDGCDWVSFDPQLQIRRELDRLLAAHDVEMRVVMEFDNIETIKRAIEIDAGVALLPEPTVDKEVQAGTLVARPLKGSPLSRPVGIIVRNNKELGALVKLFIQLLRQQIGGPMRQQPLTPVSSLSGGVANGAPSVRHKRLRRKRTAGA